MAISLLNRFLSTADVLRHGFTSRGLALGMTLTHGFGCPRRRGGHTLYMGEGVVDWSHAVGAVSPTDADPETIRTFPALALPASAELVFGLRALSPGGVEESGTREVQSLETDGDGVPLPLTPNAPTQLNVSPLAGGYLLVSWLYDDRGEQTPAASFNVYHDNGTGTIIGTAVGDTSRRLYRAGPYPHGQVVKIRVRSVSRFGDEETNTTDVSGTAIADGPVDMGEPTVTEGPET